MKPANQFFSSLIHSNIIFFLFFFFISLLFVVLISCKSNPLEEPIAPEVIIQPGSRNYTWDETVLEITAGESALLRSLWGASINDLWVVGDASLSPYSIWHFNGAGWKYGVNRPVGALTSIWGTDSKNIWMGNAAGLIWHYNGVLWEEPVYLKIEGYEWIVIQRLWGLSANEIYSVGFAKPTYESNSGAIGIIFKYDGKNWERVPIPDVDLNFIHLRKAQNGDLMIYAWNEKTGELSYYIYDGNDLTKFFVTDGMLSALERMGDQLFFSKNQIIYEYKDKSYEVWKDFTGTEYYGTILCNRSVKDIFTRTLDGKGIGHFNGNDFKVIHNIEGSRLLFVCGLTFEKDVYFLIQDFATRRTRILHGILKE